MRVNFRELLFLCLQDLSVSPVQPEFLLTRLLLYYTWLPSSSSHLSLIETLNRALSFHHLFPSASLYLPHSLLKLTLEVILVLAQDQTVHQKNKNNKKRSWMDTELLFTLDLGGWARPHSHWTGLSFALTDRDNPLSSTTSFPSEALARLPESVLALNIISRSTVSTFTRTEAMLTPICFMKALNEEWKLCDISLWATVPFYSILFWQHSIFFFFFYFWHLLSLGCVYVLTVIHCRSNRQLPVLKDHIMSWCTSRSAHVQDVYKAKVKIL